VFVGGVIAYANAVKTELLGVSPELLETHGAVSAEVAEAMVRGVVARTGADVAISITGVAGPGGGSDEKPIGTVWFGVWHDGQVESVRVGFPGTRPEIRARAVMAAMFGLLRRIDPSRRRQPPGAWGGTTV
jgi:PncC family amidohydrolase